MFVVMYQLTYETSVGSFHSVAFLPFSNPLIPNLCVLFLSEKVSMQTSKILKGLDKKLVLRSYENLPAL